MAELDRPQSADSSSGKGGSMHMFDVKAGFFGGHGIVGAQVPLGTGLAFADRYRNNKKVAFTYFGDGCRQPGPGLRELQQWLSSGACWWSI